MKKLTFFICLLALATFPIDGCREMAIPPLGSYSEVLLVTEDGTQSVFLPLILKHVDRKLDFYTSQEKQFEISTIRAEQLEDFPKMKTILLVGVLDQLTSIGQKIAVLIGEDGTRKVMNGTATILKRENMPAPGQMTLIVTADSEAHLEEVIEGRGDEIPELIEKSSRKRLRRYLLTREDKKLSQYLFRKYGFAIGIPTFYNLQDEASNPPGVELMREAPTRSLGIFWVDWKREPTLEDADALFNIRSKYVYARYDGDAMDSTRVTYSKAILGPYDSIEMQGYWYNTRATAGGCYKTFFIYEKSENLLWAVDLLVYAPGRDKYPLFRELLALAETFRYD